MNNHNQIQSIPAMLMQHKIIWFGLLTSHVIFYFVLTQVLNAEASLKVNLDFPDTIRVFVHMSFVIVAVAYMLPNLMLKSSLKRVEDNSFEESSDSKIMTLAKLRKVFVAFMIRLALIEAFTLIGFSIALQSKDIGHFVPFFALGLFTHLSHFPSKDFLQKFSGGSKFKN